MYPNQNQNSIQTIKGYFDAHNGLQLANRFDVSFSGLPSFVWNEPLDIYAQSVVLAPRSISTIQDGLIGYGNGRFVPRSQNPLPGPGLLVTFPVTNDNYIMEFFDNWFNYFYSGPRSNNNYNQPFYVQYYNDSVFNVTMYIKLLDPNGNVNNLMTFYEVFPVEIQPIEMTMIKPDSYLTMTVIFGFREYTQQFS